MNTGNTIYLNTKELKPIQPSGFVPPSQRVHYTHELVQSFLFEAFGSIFPKLEILEDGTASYSHRNPNTDSFISCVAAASINDIPQGEAMKLLQGWITLRKIVMEATVPEGVRSLLMNLKIPHPRTSPWFYRLQDNPDGQKKLYILIGFEGPAVTLVSLEEAIGAVMKVPPSQLESLLATSMAPSGITNRVYVLDSDAKAEINSSNTPQVSDIKQVSKKSKMALLLVAAIVLVAGSIPIVMLKMEKIEPVDIGQIEQEDTKSTQELLPKTKDTASEIAKKISDDHLETTQKLISELPTEYSDLEMAAKTEVKISKLSDNSSLEMISSADKKKSDPVDDLSLDMTIGTKNDPALDVGEKNSENTDLIEQMKK